MKMLSKEQADWLIEHFENWKRLNMSVDVDQIEKVIKECTEQPFPVFTIGSFLMGRLSVAECNDLNCPGVVVFIEGGDRFVMANDDFKKFAAGCNKIVEWINENE